MEYVSRILKKYPNRQALVEFSEELDWSKIDRWYEGKYPILSGEVDDPRKFTKIQRNFYYALLRDIEFYYGQPTEQSDEWFRTKYALDCLDEISLSDQNWASRSNVNRLISYPINFCLENGIELGESYKYIRTHSRWFYHCLMNRKCCISGVPADRAHVKAVGMGMNRKNVDHTKYGFMSLSREYHQLQHQMGIKEFIKKYEIEPVYLTREEVKRIGLPVINYDDDFDTEQAD
ncbi:putative HNHc nuclease [Vagococcus carniphilus]|uniref:putative HNHc nuclease n=1 Tax=Vagococcus carniphilus TaxID=218144 RepID=UPI00288FF720|nr:putative HNHc nuclease [Vagococcus carniphilus]MDT2832287.1 putative HNHc nuclease [Vagococcus carniphilus]MDT2840718.1 putative HNHc nuclease [Vagococcus carniphilus]MDT2855670.1 putative HNHc nuclease [Vagococcus carniphilus]